ncbi:hypothetical protein BH09PSE2_BH09PSE2_15500 [soil metagenome]
MDALTQEFIDDAAQTLAQASADLGALIAAPADARSAQALRDRLHGVRSGAQAAGLDEIARLAGEAEAPLAFALQRERALDRPAVQTVGWGVQALHAALAREAALSGEGYGVRAAPLLRAVRDRQLSQDASAAAVRGLPDLVDRLADRLGVTIEFQIRRSPVEASAEVVAACRRALLPLVRNACDHAAAPDTRRLEGKPDLCRLTLSVGEAHGRLRVTLADDGPGLDGPTLRGAAFTAGLDTHGCAAELALCPGVSTIAFQGRGSGLPAARECLAECGASLRLVSRPGRGLIAVIEAPLARHVPASAAA